MRQGQTVPNRGGTWPDYHAEANGGTTVLVLQEVFAALEATGLNPFHAIPFHERVGLTARQTTSFKALIVLFL